MVKRRRILFSIIFLVLLALLLYHQCQKKPSQEKTPLPRFPEKMEEPVTRPAEIKPEAIPEEIKPIEEEEKKPEEKPVVLVPEKKQEIAEVTIPVKPPNEEFEEPVKEIIAVLPEKPAEEITVPEEEKVAMLPEVKVEKPVKPPTEIIQTGPMADHERRIAILPFDNLTESPDAVFHIMPLIKNSLEGRGYEVVDDNITSALLCREGIRTTTYLSKRKAWLTGNTLSTNSILAGAVFSYSTGENPKTGISARLIDAATGHIIWADYASVTGDDFTGLLGLGTIKTIDKLAPKVIDKLFVSFNVNPVQTDTESMYRVAVLPFKNSTKDRYAGMIATHLFLVHLFKHELFEPVEYGDVRKMIVDLRVRHKGELSYKNLTGISTALGAGGILTGTVEDFYEGIAKTYPPKVAISARLLDGRKNKIMWFNARKLDGEDKITAFDRGRMRAPDIVANAVISELVKNMEKAKWY
jgi:TolB-like protein